MSSFWWGQSAFDELTEKATSELLPAGQVDLALHLEISDQIRSKKVNAKEAMRSFKQRLDHKNPNVIIATLSLIDTCVKNSGSAFVKEVATREFMEEMTHLVKMPPGCNQDVKDKVLSLVQVWGIASKGNNSLGYISGTYNLLRAEGYVFPPVTDRIDSMLLETAVAPDWTDSDVCERCRTPFTLTNRKHHCRQCGQTFCQQCSAKSIPLPHLGINESVRVCDGCYIKVKLSKVADKETVPHLLATPSSISSSLTPNYAPSISNNKKEDDQFELDLKKALELSKKEQDQRKQFEVSPVMNTVDEEEEANIAAAIAASLQDMNKPLPTATTTVNRNDLSATDMENIELFSTLIQRVKGNDVSSDMQINKLYVQIGTLQPKLVKTLSETSNKHNLFVELNNKLNNAVRAYDQLIQDKLAQRTASSYYNSYYPTSNQQPYQQPQTVSYSYQQPIQQTPVQQQVTYPVAQPYQPPQQYQTASNQQTVQQQPIQQQPQQPVDHQPAPPYQQTPIQQYQQTPVQQYQQTPVQQYQQTPSHPYQYNQQEPVQQQYSQISYQQTYPMAPSMNSPLQQQQQPKQIIEEAPLIEL